MNDLTKLTAEEFCLQIDNCDLDADEHTEVRRRIKRLEEIESTEQLAEDTYREMRERLTKCEADTARLDWLDTQRDNGLPDILVGGPWKWESDEHPSVGQWKVYPADGRDKATAYGSLREAIDAARAAVEE